MGKCKDNYKMGKELGSGAYSHVFQATSVKDGTVVAVKKIKKDKLMKHDHDALKLEVSLNRD